MRKAAWDSLPPAIHAIAIVDVLMPVHTPDVVAADVNLLQATSNALPPAIYTIAIVDVLMPVHTPDGMGPSRLHTGLGRRHIVIAVAAAVAESDRVCPLHRDCCSCWYFWDCDTCKENTCSASM